MLITNVHEYMKKINVQMHWDGQKLDFDFSMVNEKFEWGCYDMMILIMWCCKRCINLINAMCYIGI